MIVLTSRGDVAEKMSRMCKREKKLILEYAEKGLSTGAISKELSRHGYQFNRESVRMFLIRSRTPVQPKPRIKKVHQFHYDILKVWLNENSSQTACELRRRFLSVFNLRLSTTTVKNMRRKLDWTKAPNQYGQMISTKNKRIRMEWCLSALARRETFEDVIFVDETCVELKASGRFFFYQRGLQIECPSLKVAKPKHPYKVCIFKTVHTNTEKHIYRKALF